MPSKNSRKDYVQHSYYHVYNRGVEKRQIFYDEQDYAVFLSYLRRHLASGQVKDSRGRSYVIYDSVELLAYCLMPNHFHFLIYINEDARQLAKVMQSLCLAYSMYFNKRNRRVGHLFQDRFKAVRVTSESYLQHISRYIHLNPSDYKNWKWSSLSYYLGEKTDDWIHSERILSIFKDTNYDDFISEYAEQKVINDRINIDLKEK